MADIRSFGLRVRSEVLDRIAPLCEDVDLEGFGGLCAIVSETLGQVLRSNGHRATLICGVYEGHEHCWLEVDGNKLVDATATQFGLADPVLVVPTGSQGYHEVTRGSAAIEEVANWGDQSPQEHAREIRRIVRALSTTPRCSAHHAPGLDSANEAR